MCFSAYCLCQKWRFVAMRTPVAFRDRVHFIISTVHCLWLASAPERKEHQGKYSKQNIEECSWGICVNLSTCAIWTNILSGRSIRYGDLSSLVCTWSWCTVKRGKSLVVKGVSACHWKGGLGMQRGYKDGLLLYVTLRDDVGDGYCCVWRHFPEQKIAWRLYFIMQF
jgi:hypothetical protein